MFPTTRQVRRAAAAALVTAAAILGVPVSATAADSPPAAPTNLMAEAFWNVVALSWEPGEGGSRTVFYRIRNVTTGATNSTTGTTLNQPVFQEGATYTYEVTAVGEYGTGESAPSNRVTVTVPKLGPPTDLRASLDGNTVTLTWNRPAAVTPRALTTYGVRRGGELETIHRAGGDVVTATIPRVEPGTTHEYTVEVVKKMFSRGELSDPATLVVPPAGDTTSPTEPEWVVGLDPDCAPGHEIVVESTDDVTPQSTIRYEWVGSTVLFGIAETYVVDYDLPLKSEPDVGPPTGIRAVDEAGNRSATVFDFTMADSCA